MRSRFILAFALAGTAAAPMLFAANRNSCSVDGNTPVAIAVVNRSQHEVLEIFWVNYNCNEVAKGTIAARATLGSANLHLASISNPGREKRTPPSRVRDERINAGDHIRSVN